MAWRQALARLGLHRGFHSEAQFWRKELTLTGDFADCVGATLDPERMDRAFPNDLTPHIDGLRERFGPMLRALDVGCGPASLLALGHLRGTFDLTGVDPLADFYRAALAEQDRAPVGALRTGFGEGLTAMFPRESFHLVFTCNALDHTQSPRRVLSEMCALTAPGGTLVVQGFVREGSANHFHGLHQNDLYMLSDGRLMCRKRVWPLRRGGWAVAISDSLPLSVVFQTPPSTEIKSALRVIYRKLDQPTSV